MPEPPLADATYLGQVNSVRGGVVQVRLRDVPTTLVMVDGSAHRIGQIGAFVRIPLGYTQLYGVCTQVGADVVPTTDSGDDDLLEIEPNRSLAGYRWMTVSLFGESIEGRFDRGVGQYPTVGDEVHLVTGRDLDVIYEQRGQASDGVVIGRVAGSDAIPAALRLSALVNRHACIVGSTGSGKSNLVAVLLRALATDTYSSARVLVIDPHGEYASALPAARTQRIGTGTGTGIDRLRVPYWALPFDELIRVAMGTLGDREKEHVRERVRALKVEASQHLPTPPSEQAITADSPIPFSIRRLWHELEDAERMTFTDRDQRPETLCERISDGSPEGLVPPEYPAATSTNSAPFLNQQRRGLARQLDFMRARLLDSRFTFMFDTSDGFHPDLDGAVESDLDSLLAGWVGTDKPVTVLDVSGLPPEVLGVVVGTMLTLVYDALFWGMNLPVGGKQQPLLLVMDEAHRFLPAGADTAASRACARIAKEGRKYGVGLIAVTQRPSDIDPGVLSQCGTMVALRVTNGSDRGAVKSTVPDDLGGLTALLPSLRTGEGLVLGDALQVPSRVRIHKAPARPVGDDPELPERWLTSRPDAVGYTSVLAAWRNQTTAVPDEHNDAGSGAAEGEGVPEAGVAETPEEEARASDDPGSTAARPNPDEET